jgi:cytochrome c553
VSEGPTVRIAAVLLAAVMFSVAVGVPSSAQSPALIPWAYAIPSPGQKPVPTVRATGVLRLPGSDKEYTAAQIFDLFNAADWWTGDHPAMPDIVKYGRKPDVRACGVCHYPNGKGKPDNAPVSGLPEAYFIQQLLDYRDGTRRSADAKKSNAAMMTAMAKAMSDADVKSAAAYFASVKYTPWIRVVEAGSVPTSVLGGAVFLAVKDGGTEPIGRRILEVPEDAEHFETYRDPRVGFVAYVPPGSIGKGAALASTGKGTAGACITCHGRELRGMGPVPAIAGRSPSYLARQLHDFRVGARRGAWSDLMSAAVAPLTDDDIVNLVAYAASLAP